MKRERDNLKAGLFVVLGAAVAVGFVFALADLGRVWEPRQEWLVDYSLGDGLRGLKGGAIVTLGDQPIGVVTGIEDVSEEDGSGMSRVVGKRVLMLIPKRYRLYEDVLVEVVAPAIGSGTRVNIRSVGTGAPLSADRPIDGGHAGSKLTKGLVRDLGIRERQREQFRQIISNVESLTRTLREDLPKITASAQRVLTEVEPIVADAGAAVGHVRELTGEIRKRRAVWMDRLDRVTEAAEHAMTGVRDLLEDKGPALREIVDNTRDVTEQVKVDVLSRLREALDTAKVSLEDVRAATGRVRGLVAGQGPVIERAMGNLRLTAEQLKLTAIEVRRSPWRLLYTPDDKELETDNLYDAARSFALGAGALESAAAGLKGVAEDSDPSGDLDERIERMVVYLEAVIDRFEEAEGVFWEELGGDAGGVDGGGVGE